jgi:malate/lactate dehydrogenase
MRCKVAVIGSDSETGSVALALAAADDVELTLVGGAADVAEDVAVATALAGAEPRVRAGGAVDMAGSAIVVLLDLQTVPLAELASRCPDAVAVVATADPAAGVTEVLRATRWPRGRVVGVSGVVDAARARVQDARERGVSVRDASAESLADGAPGPLARAAGVAVVCGAIVRDRHAVLDLTVLCRGEHGLDGPAVVAVRVGAEGVEAIL